MTNPQFIDISEFQPLDIDFSKYAEWARQWDGVARFALRCSYGVGYKDKHYDAYRIAALCAGIDSIIYYHYSYPQFNSPHAEVEYIASILKDIRTQDSIMLDYEENVIQATSYWAAAWLASAKNIYTSNDVMLYANKSFILDRLQNNVVLASYPLVYAYWDYNPDLKPSPPYPWASYKYIQWSNKGAVPGVPGIVDMDMYMRS